MANTTTTTPPPPALKVLFFDVFGTCVAQRAPVADELWKAARAALESDESSSMNGDVRTKAEKLTYEDWFEFGGSWNEEDFVQASIKEHNAVDWKAVDEHRIRILPKLLARRGLVILRENDADANVNSSSSTITPEVHVEKGSLWTDAQLRHLGQIWRRLTPWPDTCRGVALLNKKFSTAALSNTYEELIISLIADGGIPFTKIYSADMFESFKPNSKVYLGAAERMGVKPEECALVAAHLGDLKGAKACGFYTIYVERKWEEKSPELRNEGIPDMWVEESEEGGFFAVAHRLGIRD